MILSGTRFFEQGFRRAAEPRTYAVRPNFFRAVCRQQLRSSPRAMPLVPSWRAVLMLLLRRSFCSCEHGHSSFVKCDCLARSERPDFFGDSPVLSAMILSGTAFEQGFRRAGEGVRFAKFSPRAIPRRLPRANLAVHGSSPRAMPSSGLPARRVDDAVAVPAFLLFQCVNISHSSFVKCDCLARSERPDLLGRAPCFRR